MKKSKTIVSILALLLCFASIAADAQEKALKIATNTNEKQVLIKEGKRIRIKLYSGEKLSGRFKIINNDTLQIRKNKIAFSAIEKIKKNPLLLQILTTAGLVYTIAFPAALLIYFSSSGSTTAMVTLIGTTVGISLLEPNVLKGHRLSENQIEVILLE